MYVSLYFLGGWISTPGLYVVREGR